MDEYQGVWSQGVWSQWTVPTSFCSAMMQYSGYLHQRTDGSSQLLNPVTGESGANMLAISHFYMHTALKLSIIIIVN